LAVLGSRAAVSIENAKLYENLLASNCNLEEANRSLEENFRQTIVGFVNALEETDRYTRGHSERVAVYSSMIAQGLGLSAQETDRVTLSAKIHDIGKIGIPSEKLNKPGRLTREETVNFRSHPEKGRRILEPIPFLRELIPGAYCHHENFDGSGYPQGLKGDEIPLMGRIITVADAYDAMTSDRAYRKALPHGTALQELEQGSGVQFDPEIVRVFLKALELHRQTARGAQTAFPAILAAGG
jgi:HD-GYP domain-containing protein (c-di-GMP phosphodiesterase class II)